MVCARAVERSPRHADRAGADRVDHVVFSHGTPPRYRSCGVSSMVSRSLSCLPHGRRGRPATRAEHNLCLRLASIWFGVPGGGNLCLRLASIWFGVPGGGNLCLTLASPWFGVPGGDPL